MADIKEAPKKKNEIENRKKEMLINFNEFLNEFKNESDRAAVVLGVAKLDYLLYQVLSKFLIPNTSSRDELFEGDGPLSTFNAKIHLAYRLGLIDEDYASALHLVRRIRNSFAHELSSCTLDSGANRDRIKELTGRFEAKETFKGFKNAFIGNKTGLKADFYTILGIMVIRLEGLYMGISPRNKRDVWPLLL